MSNQEIKSLLQVNDKVIAEEIKRILEESGIYSLLDSANPASSFNSVYMGSVASDDITIKVNEDDYLKAVEIAEEHGYKDLLV